MVCSIFRNELQFLRICFSLHRLQKIKRIYDWKIAEWDGKEKQVREHRYNFGRFFKEHDKRRGTDFCTVFPELEEFYRDD